jgi:hypothetical protein
MKQTDSSQLDSSVKIEYMHANATCWCSSGNYLTWPMLLGCRNPSASDVPLDREKLTTVHVDTVVHAHCAKKKHSSTDIPFCTILQ